jgi:hypothetical protein
MGKQKKAENMDFCLAGLKRFDPVFGLTRIVENPGEMGILSFLLPKQLNLRKIFIKPPGCDGFLV